MSHTGDHDSTTETREPSAYRLEQAISAYQQLRDAWADDPVLMHDEEMIVEALTAEGHDDPRALLSRLIDAAVWAERHATMAKILEAEYYERKRRYAERYERLRGIIEQMMQAIETTKAEGRLAKASIAPAPDSVIVTDEKAIPAEWWNVTKTLKRRELGAHIRETGELVPGATLSNGGSALRLLKVR